MEALCLGLEMPDMFDRHDVIWTGTGTGTGTDTVTETVSVSV